MDICPFVSQAEAQTKSPPVWSAHSSSFLYSGSRPSLYCPNLSPQRPFRDHESHLRCDDQTRPDYFILFFSFFLADSFPGTFARGSNRSLRWRYRSGQQVSIPNG